jgi:hypothetical protein
MLEYIYQKIKHTSNSHLAISQPVCHNQIFPFYTLSTSTQYTLFHSPLQLFLIEFTPTSSQKASIVNKSIQTIVSNSTCSKNQCLLESESESSFSV